MTLKEYTYTPEDIGIYRPIALAPEFLEKKDMGALEKTILNLFGNLGVKEEKHKAGLVKSIYASPQGLQAFIKDNIENKYQKALNNAKLRELRSLYSDLFEKIYTKENLPKVNKDFNSDETYEDFQKRYAKVGEIAQSETDNFSDEQKKQAQKDLKELNKIALPLQGFENLKLDSLRGPINVESLGQRLNDAYKEEKSEYEEPVAA